MNREELRDRMLLYVADVLEADEREALMAWREREPEAFEALLAETQAFEAELAVGLEPLDPPSRVSRELRRRIGEPAPRRARARIWAGLLSAVAGAALAAGLLAVGVLAPLRADYDAMAEELAQLVEERDELEVDVVASEDEIDALETRLFDAQRQITLLRSPASQVVSLQGPAAPDGEAAWARVFWEWEDYYCYLHAEKLPLVEPGLRYALWLRTEDGEHVLATTFAPDAAGTATAWLQLPREVGQVVGAFVTLERDASSEPATPGSDVRLRATL